MFVIDPVAVEAGLRFVGIFLIIGILGAIVGSAFVLYGSTK